MTCVSYKFCHGKDLKVSLNSAEEFWGKGDRKNDNNGKKNKTKHRSSVGMIEKRKQSHNSKIFRFKRKTLIKE